MGIQAGIKDTVIVQKVQEKLSSMGIRAPSRVSVASTKGSVTLSGMIQYEHQRQIAVHAIGSVGGVQRVVDRMQLIPSGQHKKTNPKRDS